MEEPVKRNRVKKFLVIVLLILVGVLSGILIPYNKASYVGNEMWKYKSGKHIGDVVSIEAGFDFKDKSIYKDDKVIVGVYLCTRDILIIKSPDTWEIGYYVKKS